MKKFLVAGLALISSSSIVNAADSEHSARMRRDIAAPRTFMTKFEELESIVRDFENTLQEIRRLKSENETLRAECRANAERIEQQNEHTLRLQNQLEALRKQKDTSAN